MSSVIRLLRGGCRQTTDDGWRGHSRNILQLSIPDLRLVIALLNRIVSEHLFNVKPEIQKTTGSDGFRGGRNMQVCAEDRAWGYAERSHPRPSTVQRDSGDQADAVSNLVIYSA